MPRTLLTSVEIMLKCFVFFDVHTDGLVPSEGTRWRDDPVF